MYVYFKRKRFDFDNTINKLKSSKLIEGIIQLGSGVIGYNDEHSDIDLMVSNSKLNDVEKTKKYVRHCLTDFNCIYIKEKKLNENIYLIIAFMENGLEFNISILPTAYLTVKSPLWDVIVDKTGMVAEKMNIEHEHFSNKNVKYPISNDVVFEFVFSIRRFRIELKRNNLIYALQMLETMRAYILQIQTQNENKKLHQFKAFDTLNTEFITMFLHTYPDEITVEKLSSSSDKLKEVFIKTVKNSTVLSIDEALIQLLN